MTTLGRKVCAAGDARSIAAYFGPRDAAGEPPLPGVGRVAASLAGTAGRVTRRALSGKALRADPATYEARMATCRACPGGHYRPSDGRCGKMSGCGCYVGRKARLAAADCPMGYWPELTREGTLIPADTLAHRRPQTPTDALPPDIPPTPVPPSRVLIRATLCGWSGYGQFVRGTARALERLGRPVAFQGRAIAQFFGPDPWCLDRLAAAGARGVPLAIDSPRGGAGKVPPVKYTMHESSGVPRHWVARLNRARVVAVPCRWNAEIFAAAGVRVPIVLAPGGIDPEDPWRPAESPPDRFAVLMAARLHHGGIRKGIAEGLLAFLDADIPDAICRVKIYRDDVPLLQRLLRGLTTPGRAASALADPRVEVITDPYRPAQMAEFYRSGSVLLVPSKGEGWGLHTLEAMACGVPPICAFATGTADFADGSCAYGLPHRWAPAGEFYRGMGDWAVPDRDAMVETLRLAASDPSGLAARSAAAVARAAEFPWDRGAAAILGALGMAGLDPSRSAES